MARAKLRVESSSQQSIELIPEPRVGAREPEPNLNQESKLEVSFLNPHTHKSWVDPTHVGRCGLQKLVADSRG